MSTKIKFNTTQEIIDAIRVGEMVIIVDDEDRENEGDLLIAASKASADTINFMAKYGRGLICLTLTKERCNQLRLPLMISDTNRRKSTNFTMSIEAADGITTGISAQDRARTVKVAVAPDAQPDDITQPGHIFPLMSQPGGVLVRAGHTEAGCDFARLAGLEPASVIVEILNDDGTMARRNDLMAFAKEHQLKIGTIADLISYRLEHEEAVEIVQEKLVDTKQGSFRMLVFEDHLNKLIHFALVKGEIEKEKVTTVRVHIPDIYTDVLGIESSSKGLSFDRALEYISHEETGVVILLGYQQSSREILKMLDTDQQARFGSAHEKQELRTYGIGAQILRKIGVKKMRVISLPKHLSAISGFGLEITDYLNIDD